MSFEPSALKAPILKYQVQRYSVTNKRINLGFNAAECKDLEPEKAMTKHPDLGK